MSSMDEENNLVTNIDTLSDVHNSFMNIVDKPFFVKTFPWDSTITPGVNIASSTLQIPRDLLVNDMVKVPFQTSRYWKGDMCLEVQAIGTPLHQGLLIVYFKPFDTSSTLGRADSINDALASPHVYIYANQSSSTCLSIPFCVPASYASTNFTSGTGIYTGDVSRFVRSLGFVNAMVITPLDSLSTKTINVSVHARFKNMQFKVPKNEKIVLSGVQLQSMAVPIFSTIVSAALPNAIKFIKDGIDRAGKKFFKWVGLDKPSNPLVSENMRVTTTTNFNLTEGLVPLDRLTMHSSHLSTADAKLFPCENDEMSMDYILSKQQFISQFTIKNTDATGSLRCAIPIGPMCYPLAGGTGRANINVPIITKMAMLTKYWRGDINFHFKVSGTDMQTCKLLFVKTYGLGIFASYPNHTDLVNFDCETVEINHGGQEFIIKCPYNAPYAMLCCDNNYQSSYNQHGELLVYVITPLQYPSSAQPYITISAYITAGDNFSFYGPCETAFFAPTNNYLFSTAYETELGVELMGKDANFQSVPVAIGTLKDEDPDIMKPVKPIQNNRMKPIRHVRDIVRRYYQIHGYEARELIALRISDIFRKRAYNSPLAMISHFYDGLRGGLRFRLIVSNLPQNHKITAYYAFPQVNSSNATFTLGGLTTSQIVNSAWPYTPDGTSPELPLFTPLLVTMNQADSSLDFEITNENIFEWNKIWQDKFDQSVNDPAQDLGYLVIISPPESIENNYYKLFASFGDETRLGLFMHNPSINLPVQPVNAGSNIQDTFPNTQKLYYSASTY